MELKPLQKLENKLYLGTEMRTSLQLLACSSLELLDYIQTEVETNPAIDSDQLICDLSKGQVDIDCYNDTGIDNVAHQKDHDYQMQSIIRPVTIYEYLEEQLDELELSVAVEQTARWIINSLNPDGFFLDEDLLPIELRLHYSEALSAVQNLNPPGIGARNLKESLLLQAERLAMDDEVLCQIIQEDLDALADRKFDLLNKKYHINHVSRYLDIIRGLNPRPAGAIPDYQQPQYIPVDVYFETVEGTVRPRLNDWNIPNLKVHPVFESLVDQLDGESRNTYSNYTNRVRYLNEAIQKRNSTLLDVCGAIIKKQSSFFKGESPYLAPLTLNEIAEDIGFHVSTVSRAVRDKYISYT